MFQDAVYSQAQQDMALLRESFTNQLAQAALQQQPARIPSIICQRC